MRKQTPCGLFFYTSMQNVENCNYVCYIRVKFRFTHGNTLVTIFLTKCMYKTVEEDDLWFQQKVKRKSTSSKQSMICQLENIIYYDQIFGYLFTRLTVVYNAKILWCPLWSGLKSVLVCLSFVKFTGYCWKRKCNSWLLPDIFITVTSLAISSA